MRIIRIPVVHDLKTYPQDFEAVWSEEKMFEVRRNDRNFKVGDMISLKEYDPESGYTGREVDVAITYILDDPEFVKEGFVIMGLK